MIAIQMVIAQSASCVGIGSCDWSLYVQRDWCDVLLWMSRRFKHPTLLIFNSAPPESAAQVRG